MSSKIDYIAIDIAKDSLQIETGRRSLRLAYDSAGLSKLLALARSLPNAMVVCEATGGYERKLVELLRSRGVPVALINPARARHFARSEGVRAKTDPIDADMIHRFAIEKRPAATPPPSPAQRELADLMDRRSQLSGMRASERNRLRKASRTARGSVEKTIRYLDREIARIDRRAGRLLAAQTDMQAQAAAMQRTVGVGELTARAILAYLPEIREVGRNQAVALAGLAPFNRDSGAGKGRRRIQAGRAKARKCLYMAAQSAATRNPVIREYVKGLKDRGKPHKCAMVAAMRKILIHLQSILKKHQEALA